MSARALLRGKLLPLASAAFCTLFAASLLSILRVHPSAILFLCGVFLLCTLLPIWAEISRKLRFYREVDNRLDALDEKFLLCELLEEPGFAEGDFFCGAMAEVNKSMCDAVSAARRDSAEYREYVETWVHEIKTPISSARLCLENRPGELSDALERELFQIDGYVEQALFYARSSAVERDYLVRAMLLRDAAAHAVKKYARPLIGAGFRIDLEGLTATVYSDPKWVEFILGQLLSNALKYRSGSPCLTFTQLESPHCVTLLLTDNGPGIPEADLPRVFDKGFTGENGRALSTHSTGLGLYLCRKLCRRLGLGLALTPAPGGGTTAELSFPKSGFHFAGQP